MNLLGGIIILGIIIISMVLHELAHGSVALLLGDTTAKEDGRLTLNPLKHLDPVMSVLLPLLSYFMGGVVFGGAKPVPVNFAKLKGGVWGMALVAFAGPFVNFLLAFLAFLGLNYINYSGSKIIETVLTNFLFVNLGFGVFNLFPIPPLDGSRIVYAILPDVVRDFFDRIERVGIIIVYALILLGGGIFSSIMSGAMSGILNGFYWIIGM